MSDDLSVPSTTNAVSGAVELNPTVTLALAQASVAAYSYFARVPYTIPTNYKVFARFTGWDPYWGGPERFWSDLPVDGSAYPGKSVYRGIPRDGFAHRCSRRHNVESGGLSAVPQFGVAHA